VSDNSTGASVINFGPSASISADGRYVAFVSIGDVFVRDRLTGTLERLSISSAGDPGNRESSWPSISADGRYVAFYSWASNLVPGDTNGATDVFVRDRLNGTTERVSVNSAGGEANGGSGATSISADGRYVAFGSGASNLVPDDTNRRADIFVRDRVNGTTERVNVDSRGDEANRSPAIHTISGDGRYVAFVTNATNLVRGDTNDKRDVFVHDRVTRTTERVSVDGAGNEGNFGSGDPSLSADGRFVAFYSWVALVPDDTNGESDIFVRDRLTGALERVSVDSAGGQANDASSAPSLSADGRYVAFESVASNLVPGDTNGVVDVFVRDRFTGTTMRVSVSSAGDQATDFWSFGSNISADGRHVAFISSASHLVPDDTYGTYDVFVHSLGE
jgi:Tol biopolymer transport system component